MEHIKGFMSKLRQLNNVTVMAVKKGHCGIFSTEDLGMLMHIPVDTNFKKYLYNATRNKVLIKVARELYYNPIAGVISTGVLERIARLLHWNKFIYVSLETQLSLTGRISQLTMKRLTVMTTGKSSTVKTPFGVIEFTHTKRDIRSLADEIYFDDETGIFRATEYRAIADLKRVGRNVGMIIEDTHA